MATVRSPAAALACANGIATGVLGGSSSRAPSSSALLPFCQASSPSGNRLMGKRAIRYAAAARRKSCRAPASSSARQSRADGSRSLSPDRSSSCPLRGQLTQIAKVTPGKCNVLAPRRRSERASCAATPPRRRGCAHRTRASRGGRPSRTKFTAHGRAGRPIHIDRSRESSLRNVCIARDTTQSHRWLIDNMLLRYRDVCWQAQSGISRCQARPVRSK
jgi:hypothetical protein